MFATSIPAAVSRALSELKGMLPPGLSIPEDASAPLLEASGGPLESLGVVNLMVALERAIEEEFGQQVYLAEALAKPADSSPFRTRRAIEEHVAALLNFTPSATESEEAS